MFKKILLGLTTTKGSDWRQKIKEIELYDLKEIALFLTCLNKLEREELYNLLEKTKIKKIPHVHLRTDMDISELDYLIKRYNTKIFNLHSQKQFPIDKTYIKYKKMIFLENTQVIPTEEELKEYGGLCLDVAHWHNAIITNYSEYNNFDYLVKKFPIGCCHISAIRETYTFDDDYALWKSYDSHFFENLNEFNYLKKYLKYLPKIISLELENSFKDQLKVKEYLKKNIFN